MCTTTSPSFIKIRWKTKKIIIDHLTEVSSIKFPLRSCWMVGEFGHWQKVFVVLILPQFIKNRRQFFSTQTLFVSLICVVLNWPAPTQQLLFYKRIGIRIPIFQPHHSFHHILNEFFKMPIDMLSSTLNGISAGKKPLDFDVSIWFQIPKLKCYTYPDLVLAQFLEVVKGFWNSFE